LKTREWRTRRVFVNGTGVFAGAAVDRIVPRPRGRVRPAGEGAAEPSCGAAPEIRKLFGAQGRTRTGTDYSTRPSNVRVYQFRHLGRLKRATSSRGRPAPLSHA